MARAPRSRQRTALLACLILVALTIAAGSPATTPVPTPAPTTSPTIPGPPKLSAAAAVLEDLESGRVLYQRNADQRRPIASLTKIMTAMVVLSSARLDDLVLVRAEAAAQAGSTIGLRPGERLTVRDLLYGALLPSANDAAVALAQHVGGTVESFVRLMNSTAARMGLRHTLFASPSGLDSSGYSTAADVASLTRRAELNQTFAKIVSTVRARIPGPNGSTRRLVNRNILLRVYPGAIGVKSGFTSRAGLCLVGAARLEGFGLLAVVLGSTTNAFDDAIHLLNYGFGAYQLVKLLAKGDLVGRLFVAGRPVDAVAGADVTTVSAKGSPATLERRFVAEGHLSLPIVAGQRIGTVEVRLNGRPVKVVPALAALVAVPVPRSPPVTGPVGRALVLFTALIRAIVKAFL